MLNDILISYNSNTEYRQCLRDVFQMEPTMPPIDADEVLDDETKDELMYESDAINRGLDEIFAITHNEPIFQKMYEIAAGQMLSQDPNIGLAVLCSYDYFAMFYTCVVDYVKQRPSFAENCKKLKNNL